MRNLIQVNLPAIVLSSVASMGVGFAWYSKVLFGKAWMKLEGISNPDKSGMGKTMTLVFITTLITAYVLAIFIHYAGAYSLINGAKTGLWAWLGFAMPVELSETLFSKKPFKLFLLKSGQTLAGLLVMGAILASWY